MSSVFGTEKQTPRSEGFSGMFRNRSCKRWILDLCPREATVGEKSSTEETMIPGGRGRGGG